MTVQAIHWRAPRQCLLADAVRIGHCIGVLTPVIAGSPSRVHLQTLLSVPEKASVSVHASLYWATLIFPVLRLLYEVILPPG